MKCTAYDVGTLFDYKFVITFAIYNGKWILCKHKERNTWETSGGHIKQGESPISAARRELYEETGSIKFDIEVICDYWACDEPHETKNVGWSNGVVFLATVDTLGELPESEMEKINLFDEMPPNLTYPDITKTLFPLALQKIHQKDEEINSDLKLSEIMQMQKQLQEKHRGKWAPLTPDYGRSCLLWMVEELGEIVSVIKKRGETYVMADSAIREAFIEEFVDVLMFMIDALLCYKISPSALSNAFLKKHSKNMNRDWEKEEASYIRRE